MAKSPICRCLALALLLAAPALAAQPPGADSPQHLVDRLRAATAKNDFPGVVDCIAPAQRRELAAGMVLASTMMVAFLDMGSDMAMGMAQGMTEGATGTEPTAEQKAAMEKAKAEAQKKTGALKERHAAIMKRYGLQQRMEAMQKEGPSEGRSPEQAIAALLAGVDERALIVDLLGFLETMGESQPGGGQHKPMELPPEVTDYKIDGDHATAKAGDDTVRFVRVDGRWYMEPEEKKPPAAM
ncbi:MAG TPA: hypothetical protein VGV61_11775 [Thermoanaerobaculia bacterium]|jgi:hypothetical protein|nr:hypothetical protein [Thermoanaerobaculia bacterium]